MMNNKAYERRGTDLTSFNTFQEFYNGKSVRRTKGLDTEALMFEVNREYSDQLFLKNLTFKIFVHM